MLVDARPRARRHRPRAGRRFDRARRAHPRAPAGARHRRPTATTGEAQVAFPLEGGRPAASRSRLRKSLDDVRAADARRARVRCSSPALIGLAVALLVGSAARRPARAPAPRAARHDAARRRARPGRRGAARRRARRDRRPDARVRHDAAAPARAGAGAAHVRRDRLARAAHAARVAAADAATPRARSSTRPRRTSTTRATSSTAPSARPSGWASSPPSCSTSAGSTRASRCAELVELGELRRSVSPSSRSARERDARS